MLKEKANKDTSPLSLLHISNPVGWSFCLFGARTQKSQLTQRNSRAAPRTYTVKVLYTAPTNESANLSNSSELSLYASFY